MNPADLLVPSVALGFFGMGLVALVRPQRVLSLFGVPTLPRPARNEVRAVYGGFGFAMAAVLIATHTHAELRGGVLLAVAVALLGMAAGRVISIAVDRGTDRVPLVLLGIEVTLAGMLLAAR